MPAAGGKVGQQDHRRDDLGGDGSDGGALDPPVKHKNVDGIQHRVQDGADQYAVHGQSGTTVGPRHVGQGDAHHIEGGSQQKDGGVVLGVGHHGLSRAEHPEHRLQKEQPRRQQEHSGPQRHDKDVVKRAVGLFVLPLPQLKGGVGAAAGANEGGKGQHDRHHGKGHRGSGVAQLPDSLADENLIHDVVDGVDQHGNDRRNGEVEQQPSNGLVAQRIARRPLLHADRTLRAHGPIPPVGCSSEHFPPCGRAACPPARSPPGTCPGLGSHSTAPGRQTLSARWVPPSA